jgi:hypothetical protein
LKYSDANKQSPVSMALTEHHFLFVYADKFQSVRRLDEAVVFEQALPQRIGKVTPKNEKQNKKRKKENLNKNYQVQGICVDESSAPRLMWVYSESALFEVLIVNEDRDISALYLKLGQFDLARTYAKTQEQVKLQERKM